MADSEAALQISIHKMLTVTFKLGLNISKSRMKTVAFKGRDSVNTNIVINNTIKEE